MAHYYLQYVQNTEYIPLEGVSNVIRTSLSVRTPICIESYEFHHLLTFLIVGEQLHNTEINFFSMIC